MKFKILVKVRYVLMSKDGLIVVKIIYIDGIYHISIVRIFSFFQLDFLNAKLFVRAYFFFQCRFKFNQVALQI